MEESQKRFSDAILVEAKRQHAILSRGVAAIYPGPDRQEARRLVQQHAVKVDGNVVADPRHRFFAPATFVLAAGKRRMTRVRLG
jgi:tyrosyl-tRNA synthetase